MSFDSSLLENRLSPLRNRTHPSVGVSATLEEAPITVEGFTGAVSFTGTGLDGTLDVSYEGSFYGPKADNAAGVIRGSYTEMPGQTPGPVIGYFFAEQSDE